MDKMLLEDLQDILSKEADLYTELISLLQQEREIVYSFSVDALNKNNKKKEIVVLQLKLLDESCRNVLEKVSRDLFHSQDILSISRIIENTGEPYCSALQSIYSKLRSAVQTVSEINKENEILIRGSLRTIQGSLSFFISTLSSCPLYQKSGQVKSDATSFPLLQREV